MHAKDPPLTDGSTGEEHMSKPAIGRNPFAKIVAVMAVGFGIGLGLCGLDYVLAANGIGKSTEEFGVGPLDAPSMIVMALSACGLVIATILWVAFAIV
jgi:hypothetical protein